MLSVEAGRRRKCARAINWVGNIEPKPKQTWYNNAGLAVYIRYDSKAKNVSQRSRSLFSRHRKSWEDILLTINRQSTTFPAITTHPTPRFID